jgi:CIC family chloride channel protein
MEERKIQAKKEGIPAFLFYGLAILVGIVAGLGAAAFRGLIAFFHNLLFLGQLSLEYDANVHTSPSPWGAMVILVPVVGAVGVVYLVKNFAPEAKGHGVPEVMDAIYYNKGKIRPTVALIKSLASAISIGTGGAVGREGPIIQIGASFGSTLGQIISMPAWRRITLVAAGAGGGIAATFNTPVGGVLFAAEIVLHEVSARTIVPVAISTATATYVGRVIFGSKPSFVIPQLEQAYFRVTDPVVLFSYAGLGLLLGLVSTLFIKSIYRFEDFFQERIKGGYYVQHVSGMLVVGCVIYLLMVSTGHYYVEGVGYATIQDILSGALTSLPLLLLLFALKLFCTSVTLGSGASGGIFSPALFLGATLGGAYGVVLGLIFPALSVSPPAFAVAGMASIVGGTTGAAMAAIVMIFEMTLDYNVIIPMTVTVALAYGIRRILCRESIYTLKLARRGHSIPEAFQANSYQLIRAAEIMKTEIAFVSATDTLEQLMTKGPEISDGTWLLVQQGETLVGLLSRQAATDILKTGEREKAVGQVARKDFVTVSAQDTAIDVIAEMNEAGAALAVVEAQAGPTADSRIKGVIEREKLADLILIGLELFSNK